MCIYSCHVVFGHTVAGMEYITAIENQKVDVNHRPYADVRIHNCGELVRMKSELTTCGIYICVYAQSCTMCMYIHVCAQTCICTLFVRGLS